MVTHGKQCSCQCKKCEFNSCVREPIEKEMATHSSILGNPMDRGAWWATVLGSKRFGHELATTTTITNGIFLVKNLH